MALRTSRKMWIILAIVIVAVGAIVGVALSRNPSNPESPSEFTLPIITWNETSLSELQGTPAVLVFWTTNCPYCNVQLHLAENATQQSEGELKVVAINIGESASKVESFFGDYEPAMIVALDSNGKTFADYCLAYNNTRGSVPFTLFVDAGSVVQYAKVGAFASQEALSSALHDVFGITAPQTS